MFQVLVARRLALVAGGLLALGCGPLLEPLAASCGGEAADIAALQGAGSSSPRLRERATVEGVVTLVTPDADPPGFFLQSLPPNGNSLGSQGLFVRAEDQLPAQLTPGRRVRVRGRVAEIDGVTALSELELIEPCAVEPLAPVAALLGDASDADPERWESMLIQSSDTWTLVDTAQLESAGQVLISAQGRSYAAGHPLGQEAVAHWALSGLAPALGTWLREGTVSRHLRLGAEASQLRALVQAGPPPLLLASDPPAFRAEPAPPAPPRPARALRVAALNLDNYFAEPGSRGASSQAELDRQRAKLVAVLHELDADVLALSELGNDPISDVATPGAGASLAVLLAAIDAAAPGELTYRVSESSGSPSGVLRSAIAYRSRQLQPAGPAWFAADVAFRRAPLLQRFQSASGSFTLAVVHLKSKVCSGAPEIVGPEGCGAQQRLEEARALLRMLGSFPPEQADETLVIGDFNSDAMEAPLRELRAGGLVDLFQGLSAAERYSYVFEGRASQLDHALAGPTLAARLSGAHIWHINADEPALLGYELEHATRAYSPDARRASDHDPIVVDLAP